MEEEKIRVSPFAGHTGSKIIFDDEKKTPAIVSKACRYLLKKQEIAVIDLLNRYTFLNSHMIGVVLSRDMGYPATAIKTMLAKLVRNRLIARFRIAYKDTFGTEHRSSYVYMIRDEALKARRAELTCEGVQAYLAFNQFYINISHIYQPALDDIRYTKDEEHCMDGSVRFHSLGKPLRMDVITVRHYSDVMEILKAVEEYPNSADNLLILCEGELHALELERVRASLNEKKHKEAFYMTDATTGKEELPFTTLVHVLPGEKEYEIVTIPVDGSTRGIHEADQAEE